MAHLIYSLTDLESARDDLMFELHKQPQQSPTDNAVSYINNLHYKLFCWFTSQINKIIIV
jgi:hypothetical protein